ncbi:stage V sporulation protein B [Jeotgalibacillus proteolyticus]|uniref:Stage V sporulation protein B n=1 Tax=Jeotgalibacillus proteolyticus TaxID=2082395 RepID=A0A2S5GFF9_9BACL|nr:stage V sporulation protein B [Jeotgalibacillus proteolyticus]PPA71782.1 stage V sporulation protein B [Jeotgalibacillus proteolyticus]
MSTFIRGTLILIFAAMLTKVLGFVHRMVLARMVGEEGVGLYMMTFPTLMLVITITQLGLPIAIAKYVSESTAKKEEQVVHRILTVSLLITGTLALIFTPVMFVLAPYLTETLFADNRTYWPFIAILPIIPIAAFSAVLRGYFQGKQQMGVTAAGSIIEQIVRLALLYVFVGMLLPMGIEYAAAGAMLASIGGELLSLGYLYFHFVYSRRGIKKALKIQNSYPERGVIAKQLLSIALPSTGSRMIGSIAWFLEPIVVMKCLVIAGFTAAVATQEYGVLTGFVLPLLLLPSFITVSLSTALVPAISEAKARNQTISVEHRIQQALRISLVTGGLFSILLLTHGSYLLEALYHSTRGEHILHFMAVLFIFYYYQGPLHAVLQAYEAAGAAMINSLIGAVVKLIVMGALMLQPGMGINGAAIGIMVGLVMVTLLHFLTMLKLVPIKVPYSQYGIVLLLMTGMYVLETKLFPTLLPSYLLHPLVTMLILIVCYIFFGRAFNVIKQEDWSFFSFWRKS